MTNLLIGYAVVWGFATVFCGLIALMEKKPSWFPPTWLFFKVLENEHMESSIFRLRAAILLAFASVPLIPLLVGIRFCYWYTKWELEVAKSLDKKP